MLVFLQGIFVKEVNPESAIREKLWPGDKILAFDDVDYSTVDPVQAYEDARRKIGSIKTVTVSRHHAL